MKKNFVRSVAAALIIGLTLSTSYADTTNDQIEEPPILEPSEFTFEGNTYGYYLQWIDLNDKTLKVELSLAEQKIGSVETLEKLSAPKNENESVIASINGSFFNMKPDSQPVSTLILDGKIEHIMHTGSVVGFDGDNQMHVEKLGIKIEGAINDQWEWPYSWSAWNINHYFDRLDAIMIFNNHYTGKFPVAPVFAVAVDRNEVIGIYDYVPTIPTHGYIIVTRNSNITHLFKLGDKVDYKLSTFERDASQNLTDTAVPFKDIRTAIGAGPTLVKDGVKVLDAKGEGFSVSKLVGTRAKRSLIGTAPTGQMAFVTTDSMTLDTLTELALSLGLTNAINLDGGGSSGMMKDGVYVSKPDRKISNALIVTKLKEQPIRISLNDTELFFDVDPYIDSGRTLVPLRRILELMGCQVKWDQQTQSVIVNRYQDQLVFTLGEKTVLVNDRAYEMDVPLSIRNSRSFVSIRFLTEFFGGVVDWNSERKLVTLNLPTVDQYYAIAEALYQRKEYVLALDYYEMVLDMHPSHVSSLKRTAYIFDTTLKDHRSALEYYKKALTIFPEDSDTYIKLGNAYRNLDALQEAIAAYENALTIRPNASEAYYGLAKSYESLNPERAGEYYSWLAENSTIYQYKNEANFYLNGNM
ncbi:MULTISPECIES: stalk domain-containing protein [unclassified Fusibacter]|uniref:stalk domain-containing protein n=1 Tax=unclassified Fusibacter TaxID=2624464 RepID=UPI0013E90DBA|nr:MULTISPECIES: phosphodiester glycosidase family protein [unclassified Fusibacter]MCK8059513.1 phosphodiester glycosidase family protein [Fusibacter sp. A2]NPE21023.1 tetratricopeptide repeat protein [Fusibacter sp. A1]